MLEKKNCSVLFQILLKLLLFTVIISKNNVAINARGLGENEEGVPSWEWGSSGPLVKRGERKSVVTTENGEVSSVRVGDGITAGSYHLHFITLEPNSLFLPVVLHADMVFYVHTGWGRLTWMGEEGEKTVDLRIGDVFRLPFGSIFFIESNLEPARQKLRLYSIFANSGDDLREPLTGPYSSIRDMVLGFDRKVLQAAFQVPESVIDEVLNGTEVPAIVHAVPKTTKKTLWEMEAQFMKTILGRGSYCFFNSQSNKKKTKLFNVFDEKPDFQNCNGWSTVITRKKLPALKGSNIGIYVVNLTKGSMMGPHWNPTATEIGIALQGEGMVRVVCSSTGTAEQQCKNTRFKVEEGDVFAIPRFHPMAQMAFNNNSFVFVGFSTTAKRHHPQYLAGKASVLRVLDRQILAASFNVTNTTADRILEAQGESVILECTSCAEEEEKSMEEARRREEEEARRREEEEERKREEERRREEEEARRKEEEEARKAEEERKKREEEEAKRREEEAAREKEEERRRQEEEARKREEEEARRQEEERRRRQEEEEARKRQEEEEARRREEEAAARKQQEQEEARREAEEEAARRAEEEAQREAEEAARRQQEEEAQREAEEARRREEEAAQRREEEAQREAEEARRKEEEAEARRREEEEAQREAKEGRRREEEQEGTGGGGRRSEEEEAREAERRREEEAQRQEEEARRREEEMERRHEQGTEEEEEQGPYERRSIILTTA